jgi:hypothetical protein
LQGLELLTPNVVGIDLQQDVRAALQIEPKHDVTLRPRGPLLDCLFREEIGNREQAADKGREQYGGRFPFRNVKHEF